MGPLILAAPDRDCGEATKIGCGLVGKGKLTVWSKGFFGVSGLLKGVVYQNNKHKIGPICYSPGRADSGMAAQIFILPTLIMAEPI